MNTALLAIVLIPAALLVLLGGMTVARYGADRPPGAGRGESARQRELIERALELQGRVPDESWPIVARSSEAAAPAQETAPVR